MSLLSDSWWNPQLHLISLLTWWSSPMWPGFRCISSPISSSFISLSLEDSFSSFSLWLAAHVIRELFSHFRPFIISYRHSFWREYIFHRLSLKYLCFVLVCFLLPITLTGCKLHKTTDCVSTIYHCIFSAECSAWHITGSHKITVQWVKKTTVIIALEMSRLKFRKHKKYHVLATFFTFILLNFHSNFRELCG